MFLIQYPDSKTGVMFVRLCELQDNRDGDLCAIELAKFQLDENNKVYKRFKRDKIQEMSVIRELRPDEINPILGVVLPQNTDNPDKDPLADW